MRLALSILIFAGLPAARAAEDRSAFFETRIRPVLAEHCLSCHAEGEVRGGLRLDTEEGLRTGGKSGPVLDPTQPENSLLLRAVRHETDRPMPKDAAKLSDAALADLTAWVQAGAPWPDSLVLQPVELAEKAGRHWAYQAVRKAAPSAAADGERVRGPIDAFLDVRLREQGLEPAPTADRATFLRRAAQLLTGLPPSAEEIRDWLNRPGEFHAWADQVVEHYLARPAFGERWARLWLDLARYADNKGYVFQETRDYPYAYTYRDWVVRAFNDDLPFAEFVRRQLAADRLDLPPTELAALGFLTVGRRFLNNQQLIIDDRIDVVSRGLLGTTLACARCHDHKSDPFTMADYYGLYGVFSSSEEPDPKPLLGDPPDTPETRAFLEDLRKRAQDIHAFVAGKLPDYQTPADPFDLHDRQFRKLEKPDRDKVREMRNKMTEREQASPHAPPRAMAVVDRPQPGDAKILLRGNADRPGDTVPRAYPAFLRRDPDSRFSKGSGRLELAEEIVHPDNPLTARVHVNRIWTALMGRGLVDSQSDFGLATPPPSHPELLDWLAATFLERGGSTKALIREICASAAWRRASTPGARAREVDAENRAFSHFNRRRLDFESFRDSLLDASGRLDRRVGGRAERIHEPPYSPRRTLYGYIDRQNLPGLFRTFDFANPDAHAPRRFQTTTAPQALFALNSPFMLEQALALAQRARATAPESREAQVRDLVRQTLRREATAEEVADLLAFLGEAESDAAGPATPWRVGYGRVAGDPARVEFTALPFHVEGHWQGGPRYPDPALQYARLHAQGGHPGPNAKQAVIRRWVSEFSGAVMVGGTVRRPSDKGDGIVAQVVSSRDGQVARWEVKPKETLEAEAGPFTVQPGDTLDFVVEPGRTHDHDSFEWAPIVREARAVVWNADAVPALANPQAPWTLGYGAVAEGQVTDFTPFAHQEKGRWQARETFPAAEAPGYANLGGAVGHPGRDERHAVIRRWTAPEDGVVDITGTLTRVGECPGAIRGRLLHSRLGLLGEWQASDAAKSQNTRRDQVEIREGDHLDFVVDPHGPDTCDSFTWNPRLALRVHPPPQRWDSAQAFPSGTLDPLAQLAQVLLMSNDFAFVD
jgi:cytochrome c553